MTTRIGTAGATLIWGGAGLALSAVVPVLGQALFLVPPPGTSWLYVLESPVFGTTSAAILLIAYILLAFGVGAEPGIAGPSRLGRTALVVLALTTTLNVGYVPLPAITIGVNSQVLAFAGIAVLLLALVHIVALTIVAVLVFRAGVLTGLARWAFPALAALTVLVMAVSRIPLPWAIGVWGAGLVAIPLVLLLTGVLILVQGVRATGTAQEHAVRAG
ncbi:hypothetical protein [Leifsonia shinshuensis]